ncbi:MAG: peptidoglycan bridge formation glycyltransferase FemA/FemB family protein [Candidatus Gracilibacteria bacterium]|nr:peptidoglycan bridge formation glycyltransferase FemA/FemB family protein [Candidatus Gracilibacteria bacterium]
MIWQTENWKKLLIKSNQVEKNIQFGDFSIEKRSLGMGQYGLFILGYNGDLSTKNSKKLQSICREEQALFIQYETNNYTEKKAKSHDGFSEGYYKKFITPYTAVINLSLDTDTILANMKPKGRYNIKLTAKKGVITKIVEKNTKNISDFFHLMTETTSRDNFSGNTSDYYTQFLETITDSELILAYKDDVAIAGGIFIFTKEEAIYYYGASTSDKKYRNLMAPYGVQFLAIQVAKKRGAKIYDFLGIAGPDETESELSGVTDFKLKLTKDTRKVSQSFIWINKRFHYTILVFIKKIKKLLKK